MSLDLMQTLPEELIIEIIGFLSVSDAIQFARTSKIMTAMVKSSMILYANSPCLTTTKPKSVNLCCMLACRDVLVCIFIFQFF
mmetsp:Transcript_12412/g.22427  ORF Transcript_12412/g.22427 Transcript_12412/m.22427 type:complete len:83 (-) Transcript_12412:1259-1507(-)